MPRIATYEMAEISAAVPEAKPILLWRDPIDVAASILLKPPQWMKHTSAWQHGDRYGVVRQHLEGVVGGHVEAIRVFWSVAPSRVAPCPIGCLRPRTPPQTSANKSLSARFHRSCLAPGCCEIPPPPPGVRPTGPMRPHGYRTPPAATGSGTRTC